MNNLLKVFILAFCAGAIVCGTIPQKNELKNNTKSNEAGFWGKIVSFLSHSNATQLEEARNHSRSKRQLPVPGIPPLAAPFGFPPVPPIPAFGPVPGAFGPLPLAGPFGAGPFGIPPIFNPNDVLYDYYDWVCSETECQLCNILTSECCDPEIDVNCFLPDSCLNNPCLSGGTCVPIRTPSGQPDFTCICLPGLTGKYCQLQSMFGPPPIAAGVPLGFPSAGLPFPGSFGPMDSVVPPVPVGPQFGQPQVQQAPAPSYGQQAPQVAQSYGQPAPQMPQMPSYGQAPQMPQFAPAPQMPSYGQAPQMPQFAPAPQMPSYGQAPQQLAAPSYGQPRPQAVYQPPQVIPQQPRPQPSYQPPQVAPQPSYQAPQALKQPTYQAPQPEQVLVVNDEPKQSSLKKPNY